MKTDLTGPK